MSLLQLLFILLTVVGLSFGQILFKMAADTLVLSPAGLLQILQNSRLLLALVVYAGATAMWLLVLKVTPLRTAYPFAALAFVFVPVLAHFLLDEDIGWNTLAGALLIGVGVWVSVYR
jgi:drug/metabolite transporter (DMT)-like permease